MNRREFIHAGSLALLAGHAALLQSKPTENPGVLRFRKAIGENNWNKLQIRLRKLNHNIQTRGIHPYPGYKQKLETGYSYGTYFDSLLSKINR